MNTSDLPDSPAPARHAPDDGIHAGALDGLSFLVAEDHDFQRRTLRAMLLRLGAREVLEASDGHTALAIASAPDSLVDIVITDLDMPGMDGMEFIRRLGEARVRAALIIVSAHDPALLASVETMTKAYGLYLLGTISKPATPDKLATLVRRFRERPVPAVAVPAAPLPAFEAGEIARGLHAGEFEPYFQPKIAVRSRQVQGAEALARWRHPVHGIVPPGAFVPTLEQHGLIDELTWVMLLKAARACRAWHAAGLNLSVSVNLSLRSLADPQLADRVTRLVRSESLDPKHVILEVTESATVAEHGLALENLSRLRMKGFGLSIDDYGTGYSSMQQLTRIAFTELKIDQSFVRNAAHQESSRVILRSTLEMARRLGIPAVAEGIESESDLAMLQDLGYDVVQGYLLSRPMEESRFLEWARRWNQAHAAPASGAAP